MPEEVRVHMIVEGRLQGVFFRYTTCQQADMLGVTGWVMNTRDGNVEIVAEGTKQAVAALVEWCRHGPSGAHVTNVRVTNEPFSGEFGSFDTRFSGGRQW